ncbi:MAG: methylmalonyl Co-A mutase-associated GTPase MeaB [Thermoflexales bacterium]|nr:methylmalonyl Co-A mutase-associated GTPase MeaB [Thermoflexales bacterium]
MVTHTSLIQDTLAGNRRALARLLSRIEDGGAAAGALLAALYPHTGRAYLLGVTGAPGTGKSTLVAELAKAYRRQGQTVSIVAVDPSSPFSGGALLGDRIRMRDLAGDAGVFIRSMATRGSLGGLARATAGVCQALDAAGYGLILIETVGAGQAEVDIARTADTTLVVEAPGMGDEVQAIKAGILEIADVLVVNKADREGADSTARALQAMLELGAAGPWRVPVLKTIALEGKGIAEVVEAVERHRQYLAGSGERERRARRRVEGELDAVLREALMRDLVKRLPDGELEAAVERILARETDPYSAADELLEGTDVG